MTPVFNDMASSSPAQPLYSIILPTYNEVENIAVVVWLLHSAFETLDSKFEVIVVDDNSQDDTQAVVKGLQSWLQQQQKSSLKRFENLAAAIKLIARPGKMGLGSAYASGLQQAEGEFVILMDADLSHHPKYLPQFIQRQRETGCDIVTGTRYRYGGGVAGWGFTRKLVSRGANLLASAFLGASMSDLTGSYRLYRRDCLVKLLAETSSKGYAFQMEVIVRAQYSRHTVEEVPIVFVDRLYVS
eukprot:gene22866-30039_t